MRHGSTVQLICWLFIILICSFVTNGCSKEGTSIVNAEPGEVLKINTEYQSVFLDNGQVFFGKLENAGSKYPSLKDVYYIQSQEDPATKQVNNVLTKRGSELHGPDVMYINASHVIMIESVTSGSKVAQLIQEAKAKK
jgi:hypothetical protein